MALIGLLIVSVYIGRGAGRLGYSGFAWGFVTFLTGGIIPIVLIGDLPDRTLVDKRLMEKKLLNAQLAKRRGVTMPTGALVPSSTINTSETVLDSPETQPGTPRV